MLLYDRNLSSISQMLFSRISFPSLCLRRISIMQDVFSGDSFSGILAKELITKAL